MIKTDALIVGAGPVGLYQVFQLGLLDIHCHVVDALPHPGGQCAQLYPDKPIYDIPGLLATTGQALAQALEAQIAPFVRSGHAQMHYQQQISTVQQQANGRLHVQTTAGQQFDTQTLFIAAGAGAFVPRKLRVEGLEALEGHQVFYQLPSPVPMGKEGEQGEEGEEGKTRIPAGLESSGGFSVGTHTDTHTVAALHTFVGKHIVIQGDDDQALRWAVELAAWVEASQVHHRKNAPAVHTPSIHTHPVNAGLVNAGLVNAGLVTANSAPASVTLIHRREVFSAQEVWVTRMNALRQRGHLRFLAGQIVGIETSSASAQTQNASASVAMDDALGMQTQRKVPQQVLERLEISLPDGGKESLPTDLLLASLGLSPKLGPLADWGLALERKQIPVDTQKFQTQLANVYAVGDINTYPGKKKLIVCGFHECVLAAFAAAEVIFPGKPPLLQYTTTSTKLHQLLGVSGVAGGE